MANSFKQHSKFGLATSYTDIYRADVSSHSSSVLTSVYICNHTASAATVDVQIVATSTPNSSFTCSNSVLLSSYSLAAHTSYEVLQTGQKLVLNTSDYLHAKSGTADAISIQVSVMEQTTS